MARKTKSAKPQSKPRDEPRQSASEQKAISKADAVRSALNEGKELPDEAVAFIRTRFGIDISKTHFSAVKSQLKKREGKPAARPGRKPKHAVEGYLAPPPKPPAHGETDLLAAMETMKSLVDALGAEKVKRIADLLG